MKSSILAAIAAAAALCSCSAIEVPAPPCPEEGGTACLTVNIPALSMTRATSISGEKTVNSIQVFVFRPDGVLDAYGSATATASLQLSCTLGDRKICALVNAPSQADVTKFSDLTSRRSLLSDNTLSSFVMEGSVDRTISASSTIDLPVHHLAARISIGKITNGFTLSQYGSFTVKKIFLVNAPGNGGYFASSASPTLWHNKMRDEAEASVSSLLSSGALSVNVLRGENSSESHYFYCYPNPEEGEGGSSSWSPRRTRLVVEIAVGGNTYYYPISMPALEANHKYEITNLELTRLGTSDPDTPVTFADVNFTISVEEWQPGSSQEVTI